MADEPASSKFQELVFVIIISSGLSEKYAATLKEIIENNSGEATIVGQKGVSSFSGVTHIISSTSDFPQYAQSQDLLIPVVTPSWITISISGRKLAQVRAYTPDPNMFFSDLQVSCGDIPAGDKEAIIGAVLALGGMDSNSLTKTTTHICALTMDHPKCQEVVKKNLKIQIVLPHWFDDCLKLGKRISEEPYLLPDPPILRDAPEDDIPQPSADHMVGAISTKPEIKIPTDASHIRRVTVFKDKTVMMSEDLEIGPRIRGILGDIIKGGGGRIATSVHDADIFICHWRSGRDYILAERADLDVGNLSWLYHLITHNLWTSPLRRLMHYPLPKDGIPGFKDFKITLSNYGGEARTYLENLVMACGAEFTKSMKPDNTHVITARKVGEKCNAAVEWNLDIVNHIWLEESYARCQVQPLTNTNYTTFPARTHLGEVIGQVQLDRDILEPRYFAKDPTPDPSDPPRTLKKVATRGKGSKSKTPERNSEVVEMVDQEDDDGDEEEPEVEFPKPKKAAAKPKAKSRTAIAAQLSTPASARQARGVLQADTPSSTNSRSAKDRANQTIHALKDDIALYEKEKKAKGAVWGGKRAADRVEKSMERSSSPAVDVENGEDEEDEAETRATKRHKPNKAALPPVEIRLLITGYKPWVGALEKEGKEVKKLRELGILVVDDPKTCTHLAAPSIVRTKKFLCALANGPVVLSSEFIDYCVQKQELPDLEDFILKDPETEKKFGVKLSESLTRAKNNKRTLLRRVPIYCTQEIPSGVETFEAIAKANGATFAVYKNRGVGGIKPVKPGEDDGPAEPVYLLTGTRPEERKLWPKFEDMAKAGNMIPRIVSTKWLLDVAMSQDVKWSEDYLIQNQADDLVR